MILTNDYYDWLQFGEIDLSVTGGTMPYSYLRSNGETTEDIDSLLAGIYSVVATDANSCSASLEILISEAPSSITTNANPIMVTCYNGSNGAIDVTVTGGAGGYTYLWSNGETTEDIVNLAAGIYTIVVTDSFGNQNLATFEVTQPDLITLTQAHINAGWINHWLGLIDLKVTGGTAPYSYLWSNGKSTQNVDSLVAGSYSVLVTDANACAESLDITIGEDSLNTSLTDKLFISESAKLKVYPNPSNGLFTLEIESLTNKNVIVEVFSSSGTLVKNLILQTIGSKINEQIDLTKLAKDIYYLK